MRYTYKDYLRDHPVAKTAPVKEEPKKVEKPVEVEVKPETVEEITAGLVDIEVVEDVPAAEVYHKKKSSKKPVED